MVIFVALAVAIWLRQINYAYWAGCVTAVISLLYSWFGVHADGLLRTRLEGIAVGAVIGIAASWLILPVRTSDVLRRRCSEAMAALSELLVCRLEGPERDQATRDAHSVSPSSGSERSTGPIAPRAVSWLVGGWAHPKVPTPIDAVHFLRGPGSRALVSAVRSRRRPRGSSRSGIEESCRRQPCRGTSGDSPTSRAAVPASVAAAGNHGGS